MKTRLLLHGIPGFALLITACLENPAPTTPGDERSAKSPVTQEVAPIFTDAFADGGNLVVVSDPAGYIQYMVQAPIGSKAEELLAKGSQEPNLAEVYRTLHEGARFVPPEIQSISDKLEALKLKAPIQQDLGPLEPSSNNTLQKTASSDAFMTGFCKDFVEGNIRYTKNGCNWVLSSNWQITSGNLQSDGLIMDRSYGWNATEWTAIMHLTASTWMPTIPPYFVGWVQWGGVYSNARAKISLPIGKKGELGITSHRATRIQ
jgi:hypothetical protein